MDSYCMWFGFVLCLCINRLMWFYVDCCWFEEILSGIWIFVIIKRSLVRFVIKSWLWILHFFFLHNTLFFHFMLIISSIIIIWKGIWNIYCFWSHYLYIIQFFDSVWTPIIIYFPILALFMPILSNQLLYLFYF